MMTPVKTLCLAIWASAAILAGVPQTANTQTPFEPAAVVNDEAITRFELDQRVRAQSALSGAEPSAAMARAVLGALISDRLKIQAARAAGVSVPDESIEDGFDTLARQRNLTRDQFFALLNRAGASKQTVRDLIYAEIAWRQVIRQRYGARARASEADVEREMRLIKGEPEDGAPDGSSPVASRVYEVGFLVVPAPANADAQEITDARKRLNDTRPEIESCAALANRADDFGPGSGIRANLSLEDIPPPLDQAVAALVPDQFTDPTRMTNSVVMAMLCSVENQDADDAETEEVRRDLVQRNFERYADAYLQELRREAVIEIR